ncbi:MAG: hypothetical protein PHP42_09110 [Bacteroidota bacterium]|nr:hypothetical protein [Bacteroidota bacterium]
MKQSSSKSWRNDGDYEAFHPAAWEFKAEQFRIASVYLLKGFDQSSESMTYETVMLLPIAEFLAAMALELITKAYYLKINIGPKENIYTHDVSDLCGVEMFSPNQKRLLKHAQRYVVWVGKYPTPKWTKEKFKEDYDVPSIIQGGIEKIDARDIPDSSYRPRVDEMLNLYEYIQNVLKKGSSA